MRHRAEEGGPLGVEKLVTYLETTAPGDLRPAAPVPGLEVVRVAGRTPTERARIRRLHDAVATPHLWSSLGRSEDGWQAVMDDPARSHRVATVDGRDVGWASLSHTGEHEVEIVSFGLRPGCIGRGYGGDFLTRIVREAWEFAGVAPAHATSPLASRVWLHTSSWDHPHALANYRSRGFVVGRLELQDQQPGRRERRTRPVGAPPPFLVRPAVPDDATAVRGLLDALGYPCDTAVVRERLGRAAASRDDLVAVAVDEAAAVVGFVAAHVVPLLAEADPGFVRITALGVAAPLARHGIGRRLMEMVEYVALDRGLHLLEVSSGRRPERDAAHGFYPALGFEDTAPTAVRYWKRLDPTDAR